MHIAQRVLHVLRDVELAQRAANHHTPTPAVEEVTMRVAILRKVIERAFESWDR
jgi:hypothetical protein